MITATIEDAIYKGLHIEVALFGNNGKTATAYIIDDNFVMMTSAGKDIFESRTFTGADIVAAAEKHIGTIDRITIEHLTF